jgi:hypothetical protein
MDPACAQCPHTFRKTGSADRGIIAEFGIVRGASRQPLNEDGTIDHLAKVITSPDSYDVAPAGQARISIDLHELTCGANAIASRLVDNCALLARHIYVVATAGTVERSCRRVGPPARIWITPAASPISAPICHA